MNKQLTTLQWLDALCAALGETLTPDIYTHVHQIVTTQFARALGNSLGLNVDDTKLLWAGARLHDIGKLGVQLELHLSRTTVLARDSPEFAIIKKHTLIGERFFKSIAANIGDNNVFTKLAQIARSHHEWWNGKGYPDGLAGYAIPYCARIVGVVDALAAMTGPERPYRPSMPLQDAIAELKAGAGSQFDPTVVTALCQLIEKHGHFHAATSP